MEHLETEDDGKNHKYKTSNNYMELKQPPTGNFALNNLFHRSTINLVFNINTPRKGFK